MLLTLIRAHVKRQTLINLYNFFLSLYKFLSSASSTSTSTSTTMSTESQQQELDPSQPSVPISYPIKTLDDLLSRSYFNSFQYPFNKSSIPLKDDGAGWGLPNRPRMLVCHDMAGGYTSDDKWVQGGTHAEAYAVWHWYLMDVFVYFSHSLVTLPPPSWVNAAHLHGVKVLGTFITEWDEGKLICDKLLSTKEFACTCAERLAELAVALGFDGWLINMEVKLSVAQVENLKEFVSHLTDTMHSSKPGALVIWYDSVTINGDLDWQNQLNEKNKAFFDLCDGIFINYTWKEDYPNLSASTAGDRKFDIYMGVDVFGRNTYGGGQWNTNIALDVIKKDDVSAAVFAPGWVYETNQLPDFQTAQNRWWYLVEKSWGVMQHYPTTIPFYSDFDQGRGHHLFLDGSQISDSDWCNLSCQSFQPFLEFIEDTGSDVIQAQVNLKEVSYSGGGNVTFKGSLGRDAFVTKRLFQPQLLLKGPALHFIYSVKSDGISLVGLSLKLLSMEGENASVLLASHGNPLLTMNKFSSKFSKVIMPRQTTESSEGWVLQENAIVMPGYTLTEICAVCYKLEPEVDVLHPNVTDESDAKELKSNYYAVLGHLSIQSPDQNEFFPPFSAWLIEGQSVVWEVNSGQSKYVSLNISWKLQDGYNLNKYQKYIIYVKKTSEADGNLAVKLEKPPEYLGIALVEAFYVSKLLVSSGTYSLKFIIQVCGISGTQQPLDDSPSLQLDIEG